MKWWVFVVLVGVVCGAPPLKHTAKRKSVRQSQKKVHGTDIGTPVPPKRKKPKKKHNRVNDGGAASSAIPMFRDGQSNPSVSDREKEVVMSTSKPEPGKPEGMWLDFAVPIDLCEVTLLYKIKRLYNSRIVENETLNARVFVPILPSTTAILPSGEVQHSQEQKKINMLALTPYKAAADAYNKYKDTSGIKETLKEAPQLADESKIKTSHDEQPRTHKFGLDRMLFDVAVTPGQAFVDNGVDKVYCRVCESVIGSNDFSDHIKQEHGWEVTPMSKVTIQSGGDLTFEASVWQAAITDVWVRGKQLIDAVSDNNAALCMRCGNWIRGVLHRFDILHDINHAVVLQHLETCTGVLPLGVVVAGFYTQPTDYNKISMPYHVSTADKALWQSYRIRLKLKEEEEIKKNFRSVMHATAQISLKSPAGVKRTYPT